MDPCSAAFVGDAAGNFAAVETVAEVVETWVGHQVESKDQTDTLVSDYVDDVVVDPLGCLGDWMATALVEEVPSDLGLAAEAWETIAVKDWPSCYPYTLI